MLFWKRRGGRTVKSLFSIGKARHILQRWLLREDGGSSKSATTAGAAPLTSQSTEEQDNIEEQISQFMEELQASPQEWLGRVRVINFDSIRERVGPNWPKLRDRVDILAEKIIQDDMRGRDRYFKTRSAEFLAFFPDATPEEARIRCFAIVEAIQEKLFGSFDASITVGPKVAECHLIHRDDLASEWVSTALSNSSALGQRSPEKQFRRLLRHDPEILDGADIAASTQIVIDSIIECATASHSLAELKPLLVRLQVLSRSLKTLEPALTRMGNALNGGGYLSIEGARIARRNDGSENCDGDVRPLGTAWEDISELVSVLDCNTNRSHVDLLAALGGLRRARHKRTVKFVNDDLPLARPDSSDNKPKRFEYGPVFRSALRGEHLHQGIYRVIYRDGAEPGNDNDDPLVRHPRYEEIISELAALEHAIEYLLDRKTSTVVMLMTSVHVETLRAPSSQMRYSKILRSARLRAKKRLLIEVAGYCDSDDTIGIRRAIDELRVHCHAVFISLQYKDATKVKKIAAECKRSGVHALGLNVAQLNASNVEIVGAITRLSLLGEEHSIPTFIDGIRSIGVLTKALALGVCYVSAPALRPPLPTPDDAKLVTLNDLYVMI